MTTAKRRFVAFVGGCVIGWGAGHALVAVGTTIFNDLVTRHLLGNGSVLLTGDMSIGCWIAGAGIGLIAAALVRDNNVTPDQVRSAASVEYID